MTASKLRLTRTLLLFSKLNDITSCSAARKLLLLSASFLNQPAPKHFCPYSVTNTFKRILVLTSLRLNKSKSQIMKRIFSYFSLIILSAGSLLSCKKEAIEPAASRTNNGAAPLFTRNYPMPVPVKKLKTTTYEGFPYQTFQYDLSGRLIKESTSSDVVLSFTYSDNQVMIKKTWANEPNLPYIDATATLDSKGRVTKIEGILGKDFDFKEVVSYTYTYDADGHLKQWKGKQNTSFGEAYLIMNYSWKDGNIASESFYKNFALQYTNKYEYDSLHVDKRGLWDNIHGIWSDNLFGVRNKNPMIKSTAINSVSEIPIYWTWSFDAEGYPINKNRMQKGLVYTTTKHYFL